MGDAAEDGSVSCDDEAAAEVDNDDDARFLPRRGCSGEGGRAERTLTGAAAAVEEDDDDATTRARRASSIRNPAAISAFVRRKRVRFGAGSPPAAVTLTVTAAAFLPPGGFVSAAVETAIALPVEPCSGTAPR